MSKIPDHIVRHALTKSTDADWLHSMHHIPSLAIHIAKNPNTTSDTLHSIVSNWVDTDIDHPHAEDLSSALPFMLGYQGLHGGRGAYRADFEGWAYTPHPNLRSDTRSLIRSVINDRVDKVADEMSREQAILTKLQADPNFKFDKHTIKHHDRVNSLGDLLTHLGRIRDRV